MTRTNIGISGIDWDLYRKIRVQSIIEKTNIARITEEAWALYLEQKGGLEDGRKEDAKTDY